MLVSYSCGQQKPSAVLFPQGVVLTSKNSPLRKGRPHPAPEAHLSNKSLSETVDGPRVHRWLSRQTWWLCLQSNLKPETKIVTFQNYQQ